MAFPLDLKVVKVGDIDAPPEEQSYLWPDTSTSDGTEIALDQLSWRSTSQHPVCPGRWNVYHNNNHDLVKPVSKELELPSEGVASDNWPQIPQLSRRRSCEASGERTNCVNKAVEHLQLLQDILTDWVQKTEEELPEDTDADKKLSICDFDAENKEAALVPLTADLVPLTSVKALKDYNSHTQLKSVVNEVMLLLAWLHDDCQKTEAKLEHEKVLESQLALKIDEMSRQKLIDLTAAVQKEHDLFKRQNRTDLVTVTYLSRIRANFQSKLKLLQNLNFHLNKDIAISSKQIPLLQEKMLLENKCIDKLQNALNEEKQISIQTVMNEAEIASKYKEAQETCEEELQNMEKMLNGICHELNVSSNAAKLAEKSYYEMSQGIVDGKKRKEENEKEITILKVKSENRKAKNNAIQLKNRDERENLRQRFKETKQLKNKNKELEEEIKGQTNDFNIKVSKVSNEIVKLEKELESLLIVNRIKTERIGSMQLTIEESKKQKDFYEKNLKRLSREILKIQNQITLTDEELKRMQELNRLLREQLDEQHHKHLEMEKSLQQTVSNIKKEIESENKYYLRMTSHINELELELRIEKATATEDKEKLLFKTNEVATHLEKLRDKHDRLSALKEQKDQALNNLKEKMKSTDENFTKIIQDSEEYLTLLTPFQEKSEEKARKLERKIELMTHEEERMKREIKMMVEQCKALEALVTKMADEIEKLKDAVQEISIKLEAISKLYRNTRVRWNQVIERINQEREDHDGLMRCRKETLEEILQKKQQNLKENEQLATKYRISQNTLGNKRQEYVKLSEDTLMLKQTLKDLKQLLNLQTKMQYNTENYCQYRGLYHSKQLAYIVNTSESNRIKVKQLQNEFVSKLETMAINLKESMANIYRKGPVVLPKITQPTS